MATSLALKRLVKARLKPPPDADLIQQIQRDMLMRQLQPAPAPETWAPGEMWPGESLDPQDPGRFLLARLMKGRDPLA